MNPVTRQEFISTFRSVRSLALLLIPAVLTSALIIFQWPANSVIAQSGNKSLQVFAMFGYGLGAILCLLSPVNPAVSLVKERIQGTLELLFHTPLSQIRIYLGKLSGAFLPLGLSLIMTFPAAAACYAMGGITFGRHLGPLYLILVLGAVQLSAISLLVSSYSKNIDSAVRSAYAWMLFMVVGVLGPYQVFQGSENQTKALISDWIRHLSPLPALMEVMGHGDIAGHGMISTSSSFIRYGIVASISILVFGLLTARRLHIRIFDESRAAGVMTEDRSLSQRLVRRLFFLIDPQRRSWSIGNWTNPILVKEFRCRKFGRASWILRLIAICAVASIALTYFAASGVQNWTVEMIGGLLVVLQMALIVLLAPGMSAGLIASEVETGGWTMLRMTPQSSFSIAIGKLLSVGWTMFLVLLATLPGYVVMIYLKPILQQQVLMVIASLLLATLFTVLVSAAIGSCFRRNTPATIASYSILASLTAFPILIWIGRDAPFGFRIVQNALLVNPMSSALSIMRTKGFEDYQLVPGNWYFLAGGSVMGLIIFWLRIHRLTQPD